MALSLQFFGLDADFKYFGNDRVFYFEFELTHILWV